MEGLMPNLPLVMEGLMPNLPLTMEGLKSILSSKDEFRVYFDAKNYRRVAKKCDARPAWGA